MIKNIAKTFSVEDIYPLMNVSPSGNSVLNRFGDLTYGWELQLPSAFSLQEKEYDAIIASFFSALKILPAHSVFHRQDWYFHAKFKAHPELKKDILSIANEKRFDNRPYLTHRAFVFITINSFDMFNTNASSSPVIKAFRNSNISVKAEKIEDFEAKCEEFAAILSSNLISLRPLTRRDWIGTPDGKEVGLIQRYLQLGNNTNVLSDLALGDDFVSTAEKTAIAYKIGDSRQLPTVFSSSTSCELATAENDIQLSFTSPLGVLLDCDHIVNQIISIPSQDAIANFLEKKKRKMTAGLKSDDNRINSAEIMAFQDYSYSQSVPSCRFHVNVVGICPRDEERDVINKISAAFASMQVTSSYCRVAMPVVWYAGCPSMAAQLGKEHLVTGTLLCALSLSSMETFQKDMKDPSGKYHPMLKVIDRSRYIPIMIDTQKLAQKIGLIGGFNAFCLGPTGSGKSFFINSYLHQCYSDGGDVFIIDVGDSYEFHCGLVHEESQGKDGLYYKFDNEHSLSFDAFPDFWNWFDEQGNINHTEPALSCFSTFLKTIWTPLGGWTEAQNNILNNIVDSFLLDCKNNQHKPIFNDFVNFIRDNIRMRINYVSPYSKVQEMETPEQSKRRQELLYQDVKANGYLYAGAPVSLEDFNVDKFLQSINSYSSEGRFASLLNDPTPKDLFTSRFIDFEVNKLKDVDSGSPFFSVCILFILNAFDRKMRQDPTRFKTLVFEEAWSAIDNEEMAGYIKALYKTARKYSASIVTVSQEAEDILSSEIIKNTIVQNSDIKILLDQSGVQNFEAVADVASLSPRERALCRSINKFRNPYNTHAKEVFLKIGNNWSNVFCTEVSPEEAVIYESSFDEKKKLRPMIEEHGYLKTIQILTSK